MMASQQATWDAQRSAAASASASAAASAAAVVSASAAAEGLSVEEWGLKQEALATAAPVMPELATYNTPEGRGAAAEYFAALFPYVYATGDLTEWKAMSEEGCKYCQAVIDQVETLHAKGGWVDPWEMTITDTTIYVQNEGYDYAAVEVTIDQPAGLQHNGDGTTKSYDAKPVTVLHLSMRWNGERWTVGGGNTK
ncbi:DUF6318 family protein [Actinomyces slackii]|nr:DUF6318 family protein [Actinomyces slackii]